MKTPSPEILDQAPPHDLQEERAAIGSCLNDPGRLDEVRHLLTPEDFYWGPHQVIFRHLLAMVDKGAVDVTLLLSQLRRTGDIEAVGGADGGAAACLSEIAASVPYAHHATYYARNVKQFAKWRRLREIGIELLQESHAARTEPEEILERVETSLAAMQMTHGEGAPVSLGAAAIDAMLRVDEIQRRGKGSGLATGLLTFDHDQGGLFPGELTILAARPGLGKTSLALQIAAHNALRGRLVYFASLEMSATELSTRLACAESGVSNRLVRIGKLDVNGTHRLADAFRRQGPASLDIHDRSALTAASIRREIRRRKKRGLCLGVVDYLQLVTPEDRKLPREQQVARIVRSLKETAREYEVPILCLCQLNRQVDGDETPQLHHLRESGAIEQDADVVLFLSHHEPTDSEPHNAILTIAKNRNGETGPLRLDWESSRTRFSCPQIGHAEFTRYAGDEREEGR